MKCGKVFGSFVLLTFSCLLHHKTFVKAAATFENEERQGGVESIKLDEILASTFSASGFGGSWYSDNEYQFTAGGNITRFSFVTNATTTIVQGTVFTTHLRGSPLSSLSFSADQKFILVTHARRNLWRSSFLAKYDLYDVDNRVFAPLVVAAGMPEDDRYLQLVRWAPVGSALAFVYGNNIYYRPSAVNTSAITQITTDGSPETIYNGHTDWVYEEEMFGSGSALWFSKEGTNLAYVKFDDTDVPLFEYPMYGEPGNKETVYPRQIEIHYPKSGQKNPVFSVHIVTLSAPFLPRTVTYAATTEEFRHYIGTAAWTTDSQLMVVTLNRRQNNARYHLCETTNAICTNIYSYAEPNGWIDISSPRISTNGTQFLTLKYENQTSLTEPHKNYKHIVFFDRLTSRMVTTGRLSVGSILGWDEKTNRIYFTGTRLGASVTTYDPSETHIYSVSSLPSVTPAVINCITCEFSNTNVGTEKCRSNSASFSPEFTYYTHSCSGPDVPETLTRLTTNHAVVRSWVDNSALRTRLANKGLPQRRDFNISVANGFTAKARLYLPHDFNPNQKYPLFIDVYAGPNSQNVNQGYSVSWGTSLVSDRKIIYGFIDGRGSARQSSELLFQLNRKLGTVEIEDQIAVAKALIAQNPYIDGDRTAIWGWSYGGYATAMVMAKDVENVYKCGISVAPVTNWLYYDTIYTERYMALPTVEDNWNAYNASDVTSQVGNFRNKQFFLVHGNADDNVHYQQSMILSRALEQNDIIFNQLSYPDENHGINGAGMRKHLYHSLEKFLFRDCFAPAATTTPTTTTPTTTTSTPTTTRPSTTTGSSARISINPLIQFFTCLLFLSYFAL